VFPTELVQQPAPVLNFLPAFPFTSCVKVMDSNCAPEVTGSQDMSKNLGGQVAFRMLV
jgi:hypothetical protein